MPSIKTLFASTFAILVANFVLVQGRVVPNADTPLFYLTTSSTTTSTNLLSLKMPQGNAGHATLSATTAGPPAQFYFYQGSLVALDPAGSSSAYRSHIDSAQGATGCLTYGALSFVQGTSTNKCAQYGPFSIQSDVENSQLGAQLVFNGAGGFYACGDEVYNKVNAADGPSGCNAIGLWTVPVA